MIQIDKHVLDNGLTLLVNENHRLPICTIMVWFRVGSRHETAGITGMSHFLEHCYSMGTRKYKPRENSWIIQRLGGTKNAFTSRDYTAYYSNVPSEHAELIVSLEADRMANLSLPEANVLSEKEVIKEEKRLRYEDAPFGKMYETLYEMAYEDHPYRHSVIGRWEDLGSMTRQDMWKYYKGRYVPSNVVMTIAGDITLDRAISMVRHHFGNLNAVVETSDERPLDVSQDRERRIVLKKESELPAILTGYPGVNVDHDDYAALTIVASLLSAGRSSRLYQRLVYESHVATFASATFEASFGPALFQIMAQAQPGRTIAEIEHIIETELTVLRHDPVSDPELQRVRNQLEADFVYALETNERRAEMMGRFEVISRRYGSEFVNRFLQVLLEVSPTDIRRVADTYLIPGRRNVVILDPITRN